MTSGVTLLPPYLTDEMGVDLNYLFTHISNYSNEVACKQLD
jgi:hypothetical protein